MLFPKPHIDEVKRQENRERTGAARTGGLLRQGPLRDLPRAAVLHQPDAQPADGALLLRAPDQRSLRREAPQPRAGGGTRGTRPRRWRRAACLESRGSAASPTSGASRADRSARTGCGRGARSARAARARCCSWPRRERCAGRSSPTTPACRRMRSAGGCAGKISRAASSRPRVGRLPRIRPVSPCCVALRSDGPLRSGGRDA